MTIRIHSKSSIRSLTVLGLLIGLTVSFFLASVEPVSAPDLLVRKWRSIYLPLGAFEGGFVIGDAVPNRPGEEVIYAGKGNVLALDGRDGTQVWSYSDSAVGGYAKPVMYDLDGDSDFEVLVPLYYPPGMLVLNGRDGSQVWRTVFGSAGSIMSAAVAADVDGNGRMEIFIGMQDVEAGLNQRFEGRVRKLDSSNGAVLAESFSWRACGGGLALADTDNDGEYELYMGDRNVYMGDGGYGKGVRSFWARNLTERWNHPDWLCSSQCPVLADANNDGVLDVIVSDQRGGLVVVNSTSGAAIRKQRKIPLPGAAPNQGLPGHQQLTVYDVDLDGHQEVLTMDGVHGNRSGWPDDEFVVFDLYTWTVDARVKIGTSGNEAPANQTGQFAPTLADLTGDGIMEIIACDDWGMSVYDRFYNLLFRDTGSGTFPGGVSATGVKYARYAIVQDIDADGKVEVVVVSTNHYIFAWDTEAPRPAQRVRSEIIWYSEYRRGAAVYVPIPTGAHASSEVLYQKVESSSELASVVSEASGGNPVLVSRDGKNTTSEDLICYAPDASQRNVYNWYVDGVSLTSLLLPFDSNDPSTAADFSSYGNNGINHGATWVSNGVYGGAYYFDGKFDYIKVPDGKPGLVGPETWRVNKGYFNGYPFASTLGGDGTWSEITVEMWVNIQVSQNDIRFLAKLPSYEIGLSTSDTNKLFAGVWTQNGTDHTEIGFLRYSSTSFDTSLSNNVWHQVAFTYKNGEGIQLFLNGARCAFSTSPKGNIHCSSGEPIYIGYVDYFQGMIDEVAIYRRRLSEQQIYQHYLEISQHLNANATLKQQETMEGETWKCQVTQGGISKFSNTLQIAGAPPPPPPPPVAQNLRIGSKGRPFAYDNENLVGSYDYYDALGRPESGSEIRWYRNGILQPSLNNQLTVPASLTVVGDLWHFTVRPCNGIDFGDLKTSYDVRIRKNR